MPSVIAPSGRLMLLTRLETGAALPPAAAAAAWLWINAPAYAALYVICAALIAVPLLAEARRTFTALCLTIGGLFFPLALIGVFFGLFMYLPAAVVLLAAPGFEARRRPVRVLARAAALLVASAALAGFGLAMYHHFAPARVTAY